MSQNADWLNSCWQWEKDNVSLREEPEILCCITPRIWVLPQFILLGRGIANDVLHDVSGLAVSAMCGVLYEIIENVKNKAGQCGKKKP